MPSRLTLLVSLLVAPTALSWPFGANKGANEGGNPPAQAAGGAMDPFAGLSDVSPEEIKQAQAMMRDPSFMNQMISQLKDPKFMSRLKESIASPEARQAMERMGMRVPSEEEIAEAIKKLESPEYQHQLQARLESMQAAASAFGEGAAGASVGADGTASKVSGSKLSQSKLEASAAVTNE